MHQISVEQNPYEDIYRRAKILTSEIKKEEAEELVRHLGLIYNTFGIVIKDFIKIVARKFDEKCQKETEVSNKYCKKEKQKYQNIFMNTQQQKNSLHQQKLLRQVNINKSTQQDSNIYIAENNNDWLNQFQMEENNQTTHKRRNSQKNKINQAKIKDQQSTSFLNQFRKKQTKGDTLNSNSNNIIPPHRSTSRMVTIKEQDNSGQSTNFNILREQQERCNIDENRRQLNIFNQKDSFRVVTGRRKEERYMVSGIACTECDKYYKTMNIENNDLCDCSSRHRSNAPLRRYEKNNFTQQIDLD